MICNEYEAFELGNLSEKAFEHHLETCSICQKLVKQDRELLKMTQSLNQPIAMPGLWEKVHSALESEKKKQISIRNRVQSYPFLAIAATLLIAVALSSYFLLVRSGDDGNEQRLLTAKLLERVVKTEQNYEQAIQELEGSAESQFESMDLDLMLLYRDRLETIDTQIARCREALKTNPANAHIRRYLLAALQDKRETLEDIVNRRPAELN